MGPPTIDDWTERFSTLYEKANEKRTIACTWIAAMAHCSLIGEAVRRTHYKELMRRAAHAFCWFCSFVTKARTDPEPLLRCDNTFGEIIAFKYPLQCGHCFCKPCTCNPRRMDTKPDKGAAYADLLTASKSVRWQDHSIEDWIAILRTVYGDRIHLQTLETLAFHFLEEAGEEAAAIRKLLQLRGSPKEFGIDPGFLENTTTIARLVEEYQAYKPKTADGKVAFNLALRDEANIKARILDAKMDYVVELADTFSWYCAILAKLEDIARTMQIQQSDSDWFSIELALTTEYGPSGRLICPSCRKQSCECAHFFLID